MNMTKHSHIIILFLLMSVMAMSCADVKYKHLLADVNSYIRERPDSALVVLRSIDRCDLRSRKLCAEYSLLYAMALDKNYIDTTDVSVVMPAVDYYKRCGSADEKLRSYFYLGRIYQNAGKLDKAAVAYSLSEQEASKSEDEVQKGILYMNFSHLYNKVHNVDRELEYAQKGLACYLAANDTGHINLAYGDLALIYHSKYDWSKADSLYCLGIEKAEYDTLAVVNLLSNYAKMKMIQPDPDPQGAKVLLDRMRSDYHIPLSIIDYGVYAYALELLGDRGLCNQIVDQLEKLDGCQKDGVFIWLYRVYRNRGDYKRALYYELAAIDHNYEVVDSLLAVPVFEGLQDHFTRQANESRARNKRVVTILVSFLVAMFFLCVIILLNKRLLTMRKRENENRMLLLLKESNEILEQENEELKTKSREYEEERTKLRKSFVSIYKDRFATIGELCRAYFESKDRKDQRDIIFYRVESLISGISENDNRHAMFEARINRELDNIILRLKNDLGKVDKEEERFICYIVAGFDTQTISSILNLSVSNIYTKKSRLRNRIKKMDSPYKEEYLQMI